MESNWTADLAAVLQAAKSIDQAGKTLGAETKAMNRETKANLKELKAQLRAAHAGNPSVHPQPRHYASTPPISHSVAFVPPSSLHNSQPAIEPTPPPPGPWIHPLPPPSPPTPQYSPWVHPSPSPLPYAASAYPAYESPPVMLHQTRHDHTLPSSYHHHPPNFQQIQRDKLPSHIQYSSPYNLSQPPSSAPSTPAAISTSIIDMGYMNQFDLKNFVRNAGIADVDANAFLLNAAAEGCTEAVVALALSDAELKSLGLVKLGDRKKYLTHAAAFTGHVKKEERQVENSTKHNTMFVDHLEVQVTGKPLGEGHFAVVFAGTFHKAKVAIKFLLQAQNDVQAFEQEARTLHELTEHGHPNVVRYFGLCMMETPIHGPALIMEFMSNGSLKAFLELRGARLQRYQLLHFAKATAAGMLHLSSLSPPILHRDLAARNILVGDQDAAGNFAVRVADFGLARSASNPSGEYRILNSPSPTRWTAPEVWNTRQYTISADVWSFGVTLWEIMSLGKRPYEQIPDGEILAFVGRGQRLAQTGQDFAIADDIYRLMLNCWNQEPSQRPSFAVLHQQLEELETVERRRSVT